MQIIKIGAVWCPGCLVMNKIWNDILKNYDLNIIELDYDMDNEEVLKYNVGDILPVIIIKDNNGVELERLVGEQNKKELIEAIDKYKVM